MANASSGASPETDTLILADGRSLGFADYGTAEQTAVLWCHGGPGSRLEPQGFAETARGLGFRLIGMDRPGYGRSTAVPGRDIRDCTADALALLDHLRIDRFISLGVSTGGAYALALAAASPRVLGVIACCAVTDLSWEAGKSLMPGNLPIWQAPDRPTAIALAEAQFGKDGSKIGELTASANLPPSDLSMLAIQADPRFAEAAAASSGASFAQGLAGYADDRIADGRGWVGIDLAAIACPVIVLHGEADSIVPLAHGRHTAAIVPGATLVTRPGLGHFSIMAALPRALADLKARIGALATMLIMAGAVP